MPPSGTAISRAVGVAGALLTVCLAAAVMAQGSPHPSFDCRKARLPDEKTICADQKLSELDQANAIALAQVKHASGAEDAREQLRADVAARHKCGADKLCILDNQINELDDLAGYGAKVPLPPWAGAYRISLFKSGGQPTTPGLPTEIGQCTISKIAAVSTRLEKDETSGSAVSFANQGYQVSYESEKAIAESRIGDDALICLLSKPENCPPGDDRGKIYVTTNLRTNGTWALPDAEHMCGGA